MMTVKPLKEEEEIVQLRSAAGRGSLPGSTRGHMDQLGHAYTCLLEGAAPRQSSLLLASAVCSCVSGPVPVGDAWERTCLGLSLVKDISCALLARSLRGDALRSWGDALRLLLEDMDLMSRMVVLFRNEDPLVRHLAAKTASRCVTVELLTWERLSPVWQQECVQVFHSSPPAAQLDACLWTLTDVLKRLLTDGRPDVLRRLLSSFDGSVRGLFERLLPDDAQELTCCWTRCWGTTFCLLLDLLEALTASSWTCGPGPTRWPALLAAAGCASHYFVQKQTLLVLKRVLCQRAGEDWSVGRAPSTPPGPDGRELARCVLAAVDRSWLESVQVGPSAFFGGSRPGPPRGEDGVMLRAVSLLLLKSTELHVQTDAAVWRYLQCLWDFLRHRGPALTGETQRCSWISSLFSEQDDDLMEVARTSLSIFVTHRCRSHLDTLGALQAACASGCNPHCHFLLLLRSASFDHSLLLDFLISEETCFLEYLVRYLKYLRGDWQGFTAACGRCVGGSGPAAGGSGPATGLRLVAYDSSDEGEDDSEAEPSASAASRQDTLDRAVLCLTELKEVLTRLQMKGLFPYNPASLLKLLDQVQRCYRGSHA